MSDDSFDASAKGRTTESGAALARGRDRHGGGGHGVVAHVWLVATASLSLPRTGASRRDCAVGAENSVTITLKMPESLARGLRAHATERGVTTSEVVRQAVAAFLAAKRRHG